MDSGSGFSPADYAAITRGGGSDGIFGAGNGGGLLMGILLSQLFRNGVFGNGYGTAAGAAVGAAVGSHGLADAAAAASVTSAKDAVAAVNVAKDYIDSNLDALAKQCCCSTAEILQAVNSLTPQMMQGFFQTQTALNSGFSAAAMQGFQAQTAVTSAITDAKFALSSQIDGHATDSALAMCQTQNLINTTSATTQNQAAMNFSLLQNQIANQTCEIKQTIHADGEQTRALINNIETDRLRSELAEAKLQNSNLVQTNAIQEMIRKCCCPPCCSSSNGNGNGNGNS